MEQRRNNKDQNQEHLRQDKCPHTKIKVSRGNTDGVCVAGQRSSRCDTSSVWIWPSNLDRKLFSTDSFSPGQRRLKMWRSEQKPIQRSHHSPSVLVHLQRWKVRSATLRMAGRRHCRFAVVLLCRYWGHRIKIVAEYWLPFSSSAGTFILRYQSGSCWCGYRELNDTGDAQCVVNELVAFVVSRYQTVSGGEVHLLLVFKMSDTHFLNTNETSWFILMKVEERSFLRCPDIEKCKWNWWTLICPVICRSSWIWSTQIYSSTSRVSMVRPPDETLCRRWGKNDGFIDILLLLGQ